MSCSVPVFIKGRNILHPSVVKQYSYTLQYNSARIPSIFVDNSFFSVRMKKENIGDKDVLKHPLVQKAVKVKDMRIEHLERQLKQKPFHMEQYRQIGVTPERFEQLRQENQQLKEENKSLRFLLQSLEEKKES